MEKKRKISRALRGSILLLTIFLAISAQAWGGQIVRRVNCDTGQTITQALKGFQGMSLQIQVRGTCSENVTISRDDVTLIADASGGTVNGPDSNQNTITVNGARTLIDGLTITGGRSGIVVLGSSTIRNCLIQNTGWVGIAFYRGGQGIMDSCTVQNNARHGISVEGGSATVTNSTISLNTGVGIMITRGGAARIGISDRAEYAGNMISANQSNGIEIADGGSGAMGGNIISGNGTNPNAIWGLYGIAIYTATATLVGNNSITGNAGTGVFVKNSNVVFGDPGWGLPITDTYVNVITGNGVSASTNGGVYGFLGSSLDIRNATISGNTGNGVSLTTRSTARMYDNIISNNTANGIWMMNGGGLNLQTPAVTVTGNTLFGLQCNDYESSYAGTVSGISGNTGGQISTSCTGF